MTNDVIYGIDRVWFDDNYMIYLSRACMKVPISTYITLKYMHGDAIKLNIYRADAVKNIKILNIHARSINTAKYLSIITEHKYCEYNGFIFMELSEEFIEMYNRVNNMIFMNYMIKYMYDTPYKNNADKVVVLVDINRNVLKRSIVDILDRLHIPIIKLADNECNMYQLIKVNENEVQNITTFQQLIRRIVNNTLYLKYPTHNNKKIKINFQNKQINSIKYWN